MNESHHEPLDAQAAFARYLELEALVPFAEFCERYPHWRDQLEALQRDRQQLSQALGKWAQGASVAAAIVRRFGADILRDLGLERPDEAPPEEVFEEVFRTLRLKRDGFGRYRIQNEVGRGGMGVVLSVWDDELKRHLAMKIIRKAGEDEMEASDTATVGRFLDEAQVTAQLEHPGIVPIHELGLDGTGNLYFTMRLVKGRHLGEILELVRTESDGWNPTRALNVLLRACEALAFAHSKGVIHRDLKPANLMVGRFGEVYVMDWGLAKVQGIEDRALAAPRDVPDSGDIRSDRAAAATPGSPLRTRGGNAIGTPAYMPPEQARGDLAAMGPHSDVYSMGAILYHLLCGCVPYTEAARGIEAHQVLARVLRGAPKAIQELGPSQPLELVAICEKAMQRDPERRYRDAGALADDIRRFLEHRVVRAHETGAVAELKKWVERNRGVAIASVAAGFLAFLGLTSVSFVMAAGKKEAQVKEQATSHVVSVLTEVFEEFAPQVTRGETVSAEKLLTLVESAVRKKLVQESDMQSRIGLFLAMGKGAMNRGDFKEGARLFRDTLDELSRTEDPDRRQIVEARRQLGISLNNQGLCDEAEGVLLDALDTLCEAGRYYGSVVMAQALEGISGVFEEAGRAAAAARIERLLARARGAPGTEDFGPEKNVCLQLVADLAVVFGGRGEYAAEQEALELVAAILDASGDHGEFELIVLENLGRVLRRRGKLEEAQRLQMAVLAGRLEQGDTHPRLIHARLSLGLVLSDQGQFVKAEEYVRQALESARKVLDPADPETYRCLGALAQILIAQKRFEEALPLLEEAQDGLHRTVGEQHESYIAGLNSVGTLMASTGDDEGGLAALGEALKLARDNLGNNHPLLFVIASNRAGRLRAMGRIEEAYTILSETLQTYASGQGQDGPYAQDMRVNLVTLCGQTGRFEEAMALVEEVLQRASAGSSFAQLGQDLKARVQAELDAKAAAPGNSN